MLIVCVVPRPRLLWHALHAGLFVAAKDSAGTWVGAWEFPGSGAEQPMWSPPDCGRTHAIHKDASLKPLRLQLFYRAPPKGTGAITFHALIKRGNPNTGEFFYPNLEKLALEEAEVAAPAAAPGGEAVDTFHPAPAGVSCASFCSAHGRTCDAGAMRTAAGASADGLLALLEPALLGPGGGRGVLTTTLCRPPLVQSCSAVAPAFDPAQSRCWYYRKDATCADMGASNCPELPPARG